MPHLTDSEFTDLLDERLAPSRAAHVAGCPDCTAQVDALRDALASVDTARADEPSPLFWNAFPARVSAAIDRQSERAWWLRPRALAVSGCAAAVIVAALATFFATWSPAPPAPIAVSAPDAPIPADDLERDAAWAAVRTAAGDLDYDDALAAGISASPGTAERAAMELSDEQRAELVRLIEREIKRAGGA